MRHVRQHSHPNTARMVSWAKHLARLRAELALE